MSAQLQALAMLTRHDGAHKLPGGNDPMVRENCGACVLNGYGATDSGPNYASWERVYVQAEKSIPMAWRAAFLASLDEDSPYGRALCADVLNHGVRLES